MRRHHCNQISLVLAGFILVSCSNPFFKQKDYLSRAITDRELHEIQSTELKEQSTVPPTGVDQAAAEIVKQIVEPAPPPAKIELTLADVRAAALHNNLDLAVEVFNPQIAELDVNIERARFESAFTASARRSVFDSPTSLGTEGTQSTFDDYNLGVNVPLRTGGTANINLPLNRRETNNPFSLLNPAYESDVQFSISQPLLRNAGVNVNTHSIRVARYASAAASARMKLEAIRVLANADRVYWLVFAARGELEVRQRQYELAVTQLEQARRRVNAGDTAEIEITRAQSGVASSLQDIIIAQTQVRQRQRDLKRIINREDLPINGSTELIPATQPDPLGLTLDADALAAFAVANRMEMLELELQLAADASTVDFQRNQKLPLVTLDYNYGINGLGTSFSRSFDQIPDHSFEDWSVGVSAEIPLGNEAAKSRYHQAILQRLQRLATREFRRAAIQQEVYDALDLLDQNWQRILAARQEAILAGRTYQGEQRQFDVGLRTSTDVLEAAARLADAQSNEVQALADYQISLVDIAFATGTLLGHDDVRWDSPDLAQ